MLTRLHLRSALLVPAVLVLLHCPSARAAADPRSSARAAGAATLDVVGSSSIGDGMGGAITVWCEPRAGRGMRVVAQHLLVTGRADPDWPVDGLEVSGASGEQLAPMLASDRRGGVLVAWQSRRGERSKVYVQHLLPSGRLDPEWPVNGTAACTARGDQELPVIATDCRGGALIAWRDHRGGDVDVYAAHVLAWGELDSNWPADGAAVRVAPGDQLVQTMISDAFGGATVTWFTPREGGWGAAAQHLFAWGDVDSDWPGGGRDLAPTHGGVAMK